ncbi:BrxA/BrxB family bacilliredoxin [Streptomyces californicus]|uniref:BrxA/BrxB family bacilliredoxin n=1 Tax=Streptomyces californicus TaxID=67351 RepID=UPI0004C1D76A|nr:BrxA/BrxB family bacilliredoxin [Streptomyces californicus]QRV59451.1 BrxA/BrxB family bacilliredoxin [Streptomyces californicus]
MSSETATKSSREALTSIGFTELRTAEDVDRAMKDAATGTTLIVINTDDASARDVARPGVKAALEAAGKRPDRLVTVHHGADIEAAARVFAYIDYPSTEPSIALFKEGDLVHYVPKMRIEGRHDSDIARDLEGLFGEHCE